MKLKLLAIIAVLIILLLSAPVVSSLQMQNPSIVEKDKNEQEPLWGHTHLFVRIKEEYGNPENPQYRNLSNVTVYFWNYFKIFIPFIHFSILLSPNVKKSIMQTTAIITSITGNYGYVLIGGQCWSPILLIHIEKEGYKVKNSLPFKLGQPMRINDKNVVDFVMIKTEKQNEDEVTPIFNNYIKIIKGKISNFTEHKSGYSLPWYTFNCEDVYCILSFRDRPIIQHLTAKEQFSIMPGLFIGTFTESFIKGYVRPIFWFNFV